MLTAGVYFQYEAKHRCRTKFENQTSTYSFIEESDIIQSLTPRRIKNNETLYDSCNLVRFLLSKIRLKVKIDKQNKTKPLESQLRFISDFRHLKNIYFFTLYNF